MRRDKINGCTKLLAFEKICSNKRFSSFMINVLTVVRGQNVNFVSAIFTRGITEPVRCAHAFYNVIALTRSSFHEVKGVGKRRRVVKPTTGEGRFVVITWHRYATALRRSTMCLLCAHTHADIYVYINLFHRNCPIFTRFALQQKTLLLSRGVFSLHKFLRRAQYVLLRNESSRFNRCLKKIKNDEQIFENSIKCEGKL